MHDEKKIEELWQQHSILVEDTDKMFYENCFDFAKQYAEHYSAQKVKEAVEQERERLQQIIDELRLVGGKPYSIHVPIGNYGINFDLSSEQMYHHNRLLEIIIKSINQEEL